MLTLARANRTSMMCCRATTRAPTALGSPRFDVFDRQRVTGKWELLQVLLSALSGSVQGSFLTSRTGSFLESGEVLRMGTPCTERRAARVGDSLARSNAVDALQAVDSGRSEESRAEASRPLRLLRRHVDRASIASTARRDTPGTRGFAAARTPVLAPLERFPSSRGQLQNAHALEAGRRARSPMHPCHARSCA